MKKIIIPVSFLFISFLSFAQADTSKVEQYCQVIARPKLLSNKVTIDIDFGEERGFWADNRLRSYDGKIKKFNTIIDALNFMGREGWTFVNAYPVINGTLEMYHFAFKKQVAKKEL